MGILKAVYCVLLCKTNLQINTTMKKITIIYGSETGNTQAVAEKIKQELNNFSPKLIEIEKATEADFTDADVLLLGTSTWGIGDLPSGWEGYLSKLDNINLAGKKVALFGTGDSAGFSDSFVSAMRLIYDIVDKQGADIFGQIPADDYSFEASDAVIDDMFVGLPIDEDNEPEKTDQRIKDWIELIKPVIE